MLQSQSERMSPRSRGRRPLKEKRQREREPRANPDPAARRAGEQPVGNGRERPLPQRPGEGGTPHPGSGDAWTNGSERTRVQRGADGGTQNTSQPVVPGKGYYTFTFVLMSPGTGCHPRDPGPVVTRRRLARSVPGSPPPPGKAERETVRPSSGRGQGRALLEPGETGGQSCGTVAGARSNARARPADSGERRRLSALTRRSPGCPLLGKSWRRRLVSRWAGEEEESAVVRGGPAGRQPPPPRQPRPPLPVPVLGLPADELHHAAQGDHCGQRQAARGSRGAQGHSRVTQERQAPVTRPAHRLWGGGRGHLP